MGAATPQTHAAPPGEKESAISAPKAHGDVLTESLALCTCYCGGLCLSNAYFYRVHLQVCRCCQPANPEESAALNVGSHYLRHLRVLRDTLARSSWHFAGGFSCLFCVSLSPSQIASSKRTFPESIQTDHAPSRSPLAARRVLLLAWLCHQLCGLPQTPRSDQRSKSFVRRSMRLTVWCSAGGLQQVLASEEVNCWTCSCISSLYCSHCSHNQALPRSFL